MKKFIYVCMESWRLVRKHKLYFLLPILAVLVILTFLAYHIGPSVVVSFIYAGL